MTVDVEDYFQVQAFAQAVKPGEWNSFPSRVEANTYRILEQFSRADVVGTFFTLGWVAEKLPGLVRDIVAGGHELASHGYGHQLVHSLTPEQFRVDLNRAKRALEDAGGVAVKGYRAPTFSVGPRNEWAFEVLADTGHCYSSSVYPVKHDLYGAPGTSRVPYRLAGERLLELPLTTLSVGGRAIPIAGGGYFRLMPYWLYRKALSRFHQSEHRPGIFYFHPWEIDPGQPRMSGVSRLAKFRHYVNIPKMSARLDRLLGDFSWGRVDQVFAAELASGLK